MELLKITGIPLGGDFPLEDLPHTISYALIYRSRVDSFNELPKDKRPPRNLWDKPHRLSEYFDEVYKTNDTGAGKSFIDYDPEELE